MKKRMHNKTVGKTVACLMAMVLTMCLIIPECSSIIAAAQDDSAVRINESEGVQESAYVEWQPVTGATGYNVYYKAAEEADSSYMKLDDMLIRQYSTYMRA